MSGEKDIDALIEEGLRRYGLGQSDSALELWQAALAEDPENARILEYISYVERAQASRTQPEAPAFDLQSDLAPAAVPLHADTDLGASDWGAMIADHLPSAPSVIVEPVAEPAPPPEPPAPVAPAPLAIEPEPVVPEPLQAEPVPPAEPAPALAEPEPPPAEPEPPIEPEPLATPPVELPPEPAPEPEPPRLELDLDLDLSEEDPPAPPDFEPEPELEDGMVELPSVETPLNAARPAAEPTPEPVVESPASVPHLELVPELVPELEPELTPEPPPVVEAKPTADDVDIDIDVDEFDDFMPPPTGGGSVETAATVEPPAPEPTPEPDRPGAVAEPLPAPHQIFHAVETAPGEEVPMGAPIGEPHVVEPGASAVQSPWDAIDGTTETVDLDVNPQTPSVFDMLLAAESNDQARVADGKPEPEPEPDLELTPIVVNEPATSPAEECANLMSGARELFELGDFSGSLGLVEKVLEIDANNPDANEYFERNEATLIQMYESKLGDLSHSPKLSTSPDEVIWMNLHHRAGFLLSQVDGEISYEDLAAVSGMTRLETFRILADLVGNGVIG